MATNLPSHLPPCPPTGKEATSEERVGDSHLELQTPAAAVRGMRRCLVSSGDGQEEMQTHSPLGGRPTC